MKYLKKYNESLKPKDSDLDEVKFYIEDIFFPIKSDYDIKIEALKDKAFLNFKPKDGIGFQCKRSMNTKILFLKYLYIYLDNLIDLSYI